MADPEVETSQPVSDARSIVAKHMANYVPEVEGDEPQAPQAPAADTPQIETFDPATLKIPNKQFVANVPKALEKFKDKTLVDFANSYEEAERTMHAKAKEAAELRRELDAERQARIAAEQFARMTQTPATPAAPTDPYQRAGIDLDTDTINRPGEVFRTTLTEAERRAQEIAEKAVQEAENRRRAEQAQQQEANEIVTAFELSRNEVGKMLGREIPVEEWQQQLQDIAPLVKMREPNRTRDHKAYVETYVRLRGVPKASVPHEGNPPIATAPSTPKTERAVPTVSREEALLRKQIRGALKLDS